MLTRPDLADDRIAAVLLEGYRVRAAAVAFLSIGADPNSAAFRVAAHGGALYFLKLRRGDFDAVAAEVPAFLRASGIERVVAPIPAPGGALWLKADGYTWLLYPFVDGRDGFEAPMSPAHWTALGETVRAVHDAVLPPALAARVPREGYSPRWRDLARTADREPAAMPSTAAGGDDGRVVEAFAACWREHREAVRRVLDRAEELTAAMLARPREVVLCHADLHGGNVLVGEGDAIGVVDWDNPILAPRERDLMFIGAGIGGTWDRPEEAGSFYEGYGIVEVDPVAIAYYRYERIVEDFAVFAREIRDPNVSLEDRRLSVRYFESQFRPGDVVDIADRTYDALRAG